MVKLDSGLLYKVLKAAEAGAKSPKVNTPCECHYKVCARFTQTKELDAAHLS